MEKVRTVKTVNVDTGEIKTRKTITQESRLDRSRRIASQNSTLFRFVLSASLPVLFLTLFLLVGTTDFYFENQQNLNWLDEYGVFKLDSYDQQITITNDTPLSDLNGLTLNELFIDSNLFNFSTTSQWFWTNGDIYANGDSLTYFYANSSTYAPLVNYAVLTSNQYYLNYKVDVYTPNWILNNWFYNGSGLDFKAQFRESFNYSFIQQVNQTIFQNIYIEHFNNDVLGQRIDFSGVLIKVTDFSLTKEQLDDYYDLWQKNKESRSIDTYYNLGNIPVTNLENMNTVVFKPATEIVGQLTNNANDVIGITVKAWQYVGDIWNWIWGVE